MEPYQAIEFTVEGGLALLTLNRPQVHNAINRRMIEEWHDVVRRIQARPDIRVLIITGAGRSFQAGADIAELRSMKPLELLRWNDGIISFFLALERMAPPVIAAVNGPAMGGGLELACACTIRLAAETAKLGLPEVKLGIIPGAGGTARLPRLIGPGRAAEMILTGRTVEAQEALDLGLVDRIVDQGRVLAEAKETAVRIMANGPVAVEMAKEAMVLGRDLPVEEAVKYAQKNCVACMSTQDMIEGTTAFLEKRRPSFEGR